MYAIYGNMDPINIPPINVSINIPAPWIRHGYMYTITSFVGIFVDKHHPASHREATDMEPPI